MFNWFLQPWFRKATLAYSQAKNLIGCAFIAAVTTPLFSLFYLDLHKKSDALIILVSGAIISATPFILKLTGKLALCRQIFILSLYIVIAALTFKLGGIFAPTISWLSLVPVLAVFVGSIELGVAWGIIVIATISTMYISNLYFITPAEKTALLLDFISVPSLTLVLLAAISIFEINKRQGYQQLGEALQIIEKMKDFELSRTTNELKESEAINRAILSAAADGIFLVDSQGCVKLSNRAAEELFHYQKHELVDCHIANLIKEIDRNHISIEDVLHKISIQHETKLQEFIGITKNQTFIPLEITVSQINLQQNIAYICIVRDIATRKYMEKQLVHQATHDTLTNLPNRALLTDRIEQVIKHAKRNNTNFALFFLDIDHFKFINDSLGHNIGDALLVNIAHRLQNCLRESDTIARLGGDEFILLISSVADQGDIQVLGEKILDAIIAPFNIASHELRITVSLGVSIFPNDGHDIETLIKNADMAMFQAKENGRNNLKFYATDMNLKATEQFSLENDLRRALEKNEFTLYYQPILDIKSWKIVTVEALLRWNHPERGMINPGTFIPLAEKSGLITSIGEYVLRAACEQNKKWQNLGFPPINVAINLSALEFKQPNFIHSVAQVLEKTGLSAEYLELEITENIVISDIDEMLAHLKALKNMGVKLVIDDFGTGYSSLNYLKHLPVDKLKIDRSFLNEINLVNSSDAIITLAVIGLAKTLNLTAVAEGVENIHQLEFLHAGHCDQVQGNYFCPAVDAKTLTDLLQDNRQILEKSLTVSSIAIDKSDAH